MVKNNILSLISKLNGITISDTKKTFPTQDHFCISYHDPRSLTWSWLIWWSPPWRRKNRTNMTKLHHKLFGYFYMAKQKKIIKSD